MASAVGPRRPVGDDHSSTMTASPLRVSPAEAEPAEPDEKQQPRNKLVVDHSATGIGVPNMRTNPSCACVVRVIEVQRLACASVLSPDGVVGRPASADDAARILARTAAVIRTRVEHVVRFGGSYGRRTRAVCREQMPNRDGARDA